jgi:DNA-binding HxlR family transcriptional regulator
MHISEHSDGACPAGRCPSKEKCPLAAALEIVGGKWKIPIICALYSDGATRFNELRHKMRGISNTMLASSLKELETDGILVRTQYNEMPLRVEYRLTEKGASIIPILTQLGAWGNSLSG